MHKIYTFKYITNFYVVLTILVAHITLCIVRDIPIVNIFLGDSVSLLLYERELKVYIFKRRHNNKKTFFMQSCVEKNIQKRLYKKNL